MPNPVYRTYAAAVVGAQAPVNLDWLNFGAAVLSAVDGTGAVVPNADAVFEWTTDDILPVAQGGQAGASATPRWMAFADNPVGARALGYVVTTHPVLWVRLRIIANAGGIEFKVQQNSTGRY